MSKVEISSPTELLAGLIMTCVIDTYEGCVVATVDIPGDFLQVKQPEGDNDVHVVLDGRMDELLAKISPKTYQEYVHQKRVHAFIYCKLNVALYGTLKATLLFWNKLTESLKLQGYVINPYDWCLRTRSSTESNVPLFGMWITSRSPMLIRRWSMRSSHHSSRNMERWGRCQSDVERSMTI